MAFEMHPHLHPMVWWDSVYAYNSARRHTELVSDAFGLAIQNVGRYKREQDS